MSEIIFGVLHQRLPDAEVARRDQICRDEGGHGYTQINESYDDASTPRWTGWYSAPQRGKAENRALARRVLSRVERRTKSSPNHVDHRRRHDDPAA